MSIAGTAVTVGTAVAWLRQPETDGNAGQDLALYNAGTATVYLGGTGVTSAQGFPLAAGVYLSIHLDTPSDLCAVAAAGSATLNILANGV